MGDKKEFNEGWTHRPRLIKRPKYEPTPQKCSYGQEIRK